jgi:anthranilate phosphoribosyltransferase
MELIRDTLRRLSAGDRLSEVESQAVFDAIMSGSATPAQIGAILMALRVRGETIEEITGAALTMRAKMLAIEAPPDAIDVCGTGGDGSGSLNVSTAVAFVVAGAGVAVAKHGNRALSSRSGAADALAALGVKIDCDFALVRKALWDAGVCFLMAPRYHGAMRHVGPTRVELGIRTVFNILGPLCNPASVRRQLIGTFSPTWLEPMATVLSRLGSEKAWIVHGSDGLDELTTTGPSSVVELAAGRTRRFEVNPADAGIPLARPADLKGGDAASNALALNAVLDGHLGPYRDIVLLNAAAAFIVAGKAVDLRAGVAIAAASIDQGAARTALQALIEISNE